MTSELGFENKILGQQSNRRLFSITIPPSTANFQLSNIRCCFARRRLAYFLGAVAAFQTVAFVAMVGHNGDGSMHIGIRSLRFPSSAPQYKSVIISPQSESIQHYVDELNVTLIELSGILNGTDDCVEAFLSHYEAFCETALVPRDSKFRNTVFNDTNMMADKGILREKHNAMSNKHNKPRLQLCPCVPRHRLVGRRPVLTGANHLVSADSDFDANPGGHWSPVDCVVRQRIAIIIPFRDRYQHLDTLLKVLHPMLQRQLVEYTIFVVEQDQPRDIFNKAALMNAGFVEVRNLGIRSSTPDGEVVHPFDCFLFHDVDMLPEDDRNFYGCASRLPRHVGAYLNKFNYTLLYPRIFGGATSFRPEVFELVNGFSNEFYGWGGEDDDMLNRIEAKNMTFVRFPMCVAAYSMIKHKSDTRNPLSKTRWVGCEQRGAHYDTDGLSSLRYILVATERRALYTYLLISLPPLR